MLYLASEFETNSALVVPAELEVPVIEPDQGISLIPKNNQENHYVVIFEYNSREEMEKRLSTDNFFVRASEVGALKTFGYTVGVTVEEAFALKVKEAIDKGLNKSYEEHKKAIQDFDIHANSKMKSEHELKGPSKDFQQTMLDFDAEFEARKKEMREEFDRQLARNAEMQKELDEKMAKLRTQFNEVTTSLNKYKF